jgi:hypothetical protein
LFHGFKLCFAWNNWGQKHMSKIKIVFAIAALAAVQLACAASANVGAQPTPLPVPTAQPPQVIVVQAPAQPAPVQAAQPLDAGTVVLLSIMMVGSVIGASVSITYMLSRATRQSRPIPYVDAQAQLNEPANEIPLLNVTNHYHYHADGRAPVPPQALNLPDDWTINRKAEYLLGMGYSVSEARAYLESQHRARQLPPAR